MKYAENPLIVVVSNPADILTAAVTRESGLPADRVIGSGTSLDTARFRYALSRMFESDISDIDAYVLGEHGDSQVAIWSDVSVGGLDLDDFSQQNNLSLDKDLLAEWTKDAGAEVIGLKGATFYGIAMSVSCIVESIMTVSYTHLDVYKRQELGLQAYSDQSAQPVLSALISSYHKREAKCMGSFEELRARCLGCTACRLSEPRTNVVFGMGNEKSPILFVGEGPGCLLYTSLCAPKTKWVSPLGSGPVRSSRSR